MANEGVKFLVTAVDELLELMEASEYANTAGVLELLRDIRAAKVEIQDDLIKEGILEAPKSEIQQAVDKLSSSTTSAPLDPVQPSDTPECAGD